MTSIPLPTRVECLASLLDAEGLAIVLRLGDGSYASYAAHNLGDVAWGATATAALLSRVMTQRSTSRSADVTIALADGRTGDNLLLVPVASSNTTAAALAIVRVGRPFADGEVTLATRIAAVVAVDLRDAHAVWRASQTRRLLEDRVRVTREIGAALASERDPERLAERIVRGIAAAFGADGVSIMLADGAGTLTVRSSFGLSEAATTARRQIGKGISGHVAQTALPLRLAGAVKDERFKGNDPSISEAFVVPLRSGARTIGVLNVKYAKRSGHGDEELLGALVEVADDVANALTVTLRLRQADTDRRDAIVLYELARIALAATDEQTALREAVTMVKGALSLEMVAVWEVARGSLRLRATATPAPGLPTEVATPAADPVRAVLEERRPRRMSARSEARRPPWIPASAREAIVAPISERFVLVLGRSAGTFTDGEVDFAGVLGAFLASVLDGMRDKRESVLAGMRDKRESVPAAVRDNPEPDAATPREAVPFQRPTLVTIPRVAAEPVPSHLSSAASDALQDFRGTSDVDAQFWATGTEREVRPAVEAAALSVIGEALRNVTDHARAGHVEITLRYEDEQVVLTVEDDGVGFPVDSAAAEAGPRWSGLSRVRTETEAAGGQLTVRSEPGRGTVVRATFRLRDEEHGPYEWANTADRDAG